jgi:hypothetical protein
MRANRHNVPRRRRSARRTRPSPTMKEEHGLQKQVGMIVRSMSYITSKFTKIVDWRLAVFYYIMIVACFGGILASLFLG